MKRVSLSEGIGACCERRNRVERSNELRDRVLAGFEAFSSGHASLVDRDTSRHEGVRLIGTDPDEWFEGEQAAEVLKQEVRDTTEIEVSPRNLEAFVEGSVGWVSGRVVWTLGDGREVPTRDRKSTRLNSSHANISYAVFCLKKKKQNDSLRPTKRSLG